MISVAALIASASIDVDVTTLVMGVLFLLLYFLLMPIIINPYLRARKAREEGIDGARDEAHDAEARAESTILEYEEQMRIARREAQEVRESLKTQGASEQRDILEDARSEIAGKLAEERAKIAAEVDTAQKQLEARAASLSQAMVDKILPSVG